MANRENISDYVGRWGGEGQVVKGDVVVTTYSEICEIEIVRKAPMFVVLKFTQDTKNAETKKPMHTETGFVKIMLETGAAEAGFTHPFPKGLVTEFATGKLLEGSKLQLTSESFQRPTSSSSSEEKAVTKYTREYSVSAGKLSYTQHLHDKPHLRCTLEKVEE